MDIFARPRWLTQADGSTYHYEYSQAHANPEGSLSKLTTPEGSIQQFGYNSERLLTEAIDGNGNKTNYTYGAFDLLQSQTLPNGETLTFHYDKLTRLTEVKNSQGDSYCYEYDKAGQLISETDFTGRTRKYAYDVAGRLTRTTQADGSVETYAYDEEDKLLSRQTWQPKYQKGEVNTNGKTPEKPTALLDSINLEGYELAHEVSYTYTKKTGQLTKTINTQYLPYFAEHITEFEYDAQHRLIAEIQDGERVEVELDKYGRQTALSLPNGKPKDPNDPESAVRISQVFNQYGELSQFQINNHNPLNLGYDKLGRQTRRQNQNGFILAEHFSPSGLLQAQGGGWHNALTEEQLNNYQPNHTYPIAGTQISRKWHYDKAFNLTHTQDNHWGATEYRVNKNGQVTDVLNGIRSSEHYRYDSQLNLTQKVQRATDDNGQYQLQAANDATYGIKQRKGRITRYGNKTYKYDELGRLHSKTETKKGFRPVTTYYKWNSQSQLVELHSPFKGTWRYEYDAFGRRITKYQIQTDQINRTNATSQREYKNQLINMPIRPNQDYWHKINELWAQQEQQENPTQEQATESREQTEKIPQKPTALSGWRYLYKQDQLVAEAPLKVANTEGNLALTPNVMQANWEEAIYWLYQEDDFTPTARYEKGQLHYTVADQVGTITELLTEEGYIDYRQKLNLWGEAEIDGHRHYAANDSSPLKCNHRFVGQYYDDENGLHYNRFRYYSPETGQYISHDPIGLLGGFNPYGYVGIPTAFVDPLGLAGCPSSLTREQRQARINELAEANAQRRLQEMQAQNPRSHFLDRHGAQTTLQQQQIRAQTGINPEGGQGRIPPAATRFLSHRDQLNAIQRAQTIHRNSGGGRGAVDTSFSSTIGEGYIRQGGYITTNQARVVFNDQGQVITAFPIP
nr:RHS repeat-associated core domain-containing protein [Aggregatibacter actinomycetemcomitans]